MDLKINKQNFELFLEVTKKLNKVNIVPVLFGSLGLNRVIGEFSKANDIDFLVPDDLISKNWQKFIEIMKELDFQLKDEHEHEFERNSEIVAFGKESDLSGLSQINPSDLIISEVDGAKFKELSARQYLLCYQKMLRDEYRQEKRGKADQDKIRLIEQFLNNQKKK